MQLLARDRYGNNRVANGGQANDSLAVNVVRSNLPTSQQCLGVVKLSVVYRVATTDPRVQRVFDTTKRTYVNDTLNSNFARCDARQSAKYPQPNHPCGLEQYGSDGEPEGTVCLGETACQEVAYTESGETRHKVEHTVKWHWRHDCNATDGMPPVACYEVSRRGFLSPKPRSRTEPTRTCAAHLLILGELRHDGPDCGSICL